MPGDGGPASEAPPVPGVSGVSVGQRFAIYALHDPRDGAIRYVGKTVSPLWNRLANHVSRAKRLRRKGEQLTPCARWVLALDECGLRPRIASLYEGAGDWRKAERFWIRRLREKGVTLLNVNDGGNGAHSYGGLPASSVKLLGDVSDARIADMVGLCRESVTYHRHRLGIPASGDRSRCRNPSPRRGCDNNKWKEIPDDLLQLMGTMPDAEVAKLAGVTQTAIQGRRRKAGVVSYAERVGIFKQPPRWQGEAHPMAKLTAESVREIKSRPYYRGLGVALAKEFGVSAYTISNIRRGKTWKHVQ